MHKARERKYGDPLKTQTIKHGLTNTPTWKSWQAMNARINNKTVSMYVHYGGRGIKICDRWQGTYGFLNFLEDMGSRPSRRYSLDRIDVNGNYEPSNCRWATPHQQASNTQHTSNHHGVQYVKNRNKWRSQLMIKNKLVLDKTFGSEKSAIEARQEAEIKWGIRNNQGSYL